MARYTYNALHTARLRAGLSRRELAYLAGLSYERIRQLENEPWRSGPRVSTARLLAAVLNTSVDALFPNNGKRKPQRNGADT